MMDDTRGAETALHDLAVDSSDTPSSDGRSTRRTIAPWWHCCVLVLLIAATSLLGTRHAARGTIGHYHFANYAITMAWEWALAGFALWGLHLGRTPLRAVLGKRRRGVREFFLDIGIAAFFWIAALMVLAALALALRLLHQQTPQREISQLAPSTLSEAAFWIALCVTAGICEEFLFRGYLQQQFTLASGRAWVGALVSAVLFGAAHGYEGIAGMVMITAYGALFSVLAIYRGSLRAGMIAHGWHDSFTGIAYWALKRAHIPFGLL